MSFPLVDYFDSQVEADGDVELASDASCSKAIPYSIDLSLEVPNRVETLNRVGNPGSISQLMGLFVEVPDCAKTSNRVGNLGSIPLSPILPHSCHPES